MTIQASRDTAALARGSVNALNSSQPLDHATIKLAKCPSEIPTLLWNFSSAAERQALADATNGDLGAAVGKAVGAAAGSRGEKIPTIERGQVTFNAEGNDNPRSPFFSRALHWPEERSGVTIGRGYDLRDRSANQIVNDLTASGVPLMQARRIAAGAGLSGQDAQAFVRANRASIGTISHLQQNNLFNRIYPEYEVLARQDYQAYIAENRTRAPRSGWPTWNQLDGRVRDVIVDLVYQQGQLYDRQMPPILANSREALARYIENTPQLRQYEDGRGRADYLRAESN